MSNPPSEAPPRDVALLFTAEEIARRVDSLANEIASAMANPFVVVVVLKGAFMFAADLIRALSRKGRHPRIEFVRLESYGDALQTSGTVSLRSAPPAAIKGRPVLIVDDVLDSGLTLEAKRLIMTGGAAEARACVLVRKEGKQKVPVPADFVGSRWATASSSATASTAPRTIAICLILRLPPEVRPRSARTGRRPPARGR